MSNHPPKILLRLLAWFCDPDLHSYIEGDLIELYALKVKSKGRGSANWALTKDVLKLFRPGLIKKIKGLKKLNNYGMLNDFKTSIRVLRKEKLQTFINILGLTSGMTIALLILSYVNFELSYEDYNSNSKRVVRITMDYLDGDVVVDQDCETYHQLGPMIKEEIASAEEFTRAFGMMELVIEVNEKKFRERSMYAVDPSFLDLFGYELLHGDPKTALSEPYNIVLTANTARKYFQRTDVVGESIQLTKDVKGKITGVINEVPENTHLKFDLLASYSTMKKYLDKREDPWDSNDTFTYFLLSNEASYPQFKADLSAFSQKLTDQELIEDEKIICEKVADIHLYSNKTYEPEQNGDARVVFFLLGIALLVIVIAIVNYVNLSTAKAMDRAKEVGIRKIVGASVLRLRIRFFLESVLINLVSGSFTILLVSFFNDKLKEVAGISESTDLIFTPFFWSIFALLIVSSTLLSGIVPAVVISGFKPSAVLKGKFSTSKNGVWLRKTLVVFQFAIALFLLIQTLTAVQQIKFMQQKDMGMKSEKVVVIHSPSGRNLAEKFPPFRNSLLSNPNYQSIALSTSVPGMPTAEMGSTTNINLTDSPKEYRNNFFLYAIDSNFVPALEMEIVAGQNFSEEHNLKHILVNEEALKSWGLSNPEEAVGRKTKFWGEERTVLGVIKNFHQIGVKSAHIPMIFVYGNDGGYMSVRLGNGDILNQMESLETTYHEHFPNNPFDFFFLDQELDHLYKTDQQFQWVFSVLSVFAIVITCLGLWGLASFSVAKRAKEIGIRKVLGARVSQIIFMISTDFLVLVGVAAIISLPITFYLVSEWLNQYAFRIDLGMLLFLIPSLLILLVAFFTVFGKSYGISVANPVESLRDE
ncbi:ABC transporter permease [Ekhidna sp.]